MDSIDLCSLELMDAYYRELYVGTANYSRDKEELYDGYARNCYADVDSAYNLIDNKDQVIVIVKPFFPYQGEEYDDLISDIKGNNFTITKSLMKKLSPYTVSLYSSKSFDIDSIGDRLSFRGHEDSQTNWYILRNDGLYTDFGLHTEEAGSDIYL